MDINGTWYSRDCIRKISLISQRRKYNSLGDWLVYAYYVYLVFENKVIRKELVFNIKAQAEQSRKQLIEQLNK